MNYDSLVAHSGHNIECKAYVTPYGERGVHVECLDCLVLLLDATQD